MNEYNFREWSIVKTVTRNAKEIAYIVKHKEQKLPSPHRMQLFRRVLDEDGSDYYSDYFLHGKILYNATVLQYHKVAITSRKRKELWALRDHYSSTLKEELISRKDEPLSSEEIAHIANELFSLFHYFCEKQFIDLDFDVLERIVIMEDGSLKYNQLNLIAPKEKSKIDQEILLLATLVCTIKRETELEKIIQAIDWKTQEFSKFFEDELSVPAEIITFMEKVRTKKVLHPSLLGFLPSNSKYKLSTSTQPNVKSSPKKALRKTESTATPPNEKYAVLQVDSEKKLMAVFKSGLQANAQKIRFSNFKDLKNMLKFFQAAKFENLQALSFKNNPLSLKFIEDFCLVKSLKSIQELNLTGANIGPMEIALIADSFYFHSIRKLNLSSCQITDNGVKYIAESVSLSNTLIDLDVSFQKIKLKSKALQFLCESPLHNKLIRLSVAYNQIDQPGLKLLLTQNYFPQLEDLDLTGNPCTEPNDYLRLLNEPFIRGLKKASLRNLNTAPPSGTISINKEYACYLESLNYELPSNRGLQDLFSNECFNQLVELNVGSFNIDSKDIPNLKALRHSEIQLKALTIRLADTIIKERTLISRWTEFLTIRTAFKNLQKLDLGRTGITDSGIQVLAIDANCIELKQLFLPLTKITGKAIKALSKSAFAKNLETLDVSYTPAAESDGARYFQRFRKLQTLSFFLTSNKVINPEKLLKQLSRMTNLKQIGLSAYFVVYVKEAMDTFFRILDSKGCFKIHIEPAINSKIQLFIQEIASSCPNGVFIYRTDK